MRTITRGSAQRQDCGVRHPLTPPLALFGLLTMASSLVTTDLPAQEYDPLAAALAADGIIDNLEAPVVPQCYTKTGGTPNPCWTCHTRPQGTNFRDDGYLQEEYDFSDIGWVNHWSNLFVDRTDDMAEIGDAEILSYIRQDNYPGLRDALVERTDYPGYVPDLDLAAGFDAYGFARDGSGWRVLRFKPFLATYWPTNGSTSEVYVRLPDAFRRNEAGGASNAVYRINLSILEAAMTADPRVQDDDALVREVESIDESLAGIDLDGNGQIGGLVSVIRGLPNRYVGGAANVAVSRHLYPVGTEFIQVLRYLDPDQSGFASKRIKELRYARKVLFLDVWALLRAYEEEQNHKEEGWLPFYAGSAFAGLRNDFGWQLQGFIEDAAGRLRLQTEEETYYCMGCHSSIGVTVDQTFAFPRKLPGSAGWQTQSLAGIPDVPQLGHAEPETLTYFERTRGGNAFRANDEILARFFPLGRFDEDSVRRAAPGGDRDIRHLIEPSRERALALDKAYFTLVQQQEFKLGRDPFLAPPKNVYDSVCEWCHTTSASTGLLEQGRTYYDGTLWLDWSSISQAR